MVNNAEKPTAASESAETPIELSENITVACAAEPGDDEIVSPIDHPDSVSRWVKRVIYGALVGVGAILPGVSGGAFCAAFGIYRPMMDFFAHPTRNFKKNIRFFLPFGIGCALGFVLLAGLVSLLLEKAGSCVVAFFVGCIIGTLPSLYKEANGKRWKPFHWILLAGSTGLTVMGLLYMEKVGNMLELIADPKSLSYLLTWLVCGAIFCLGSIVPGMSPSAIIMYADLYKPMTDGIASFNLSIVLPFLLGAALCIVLLSRLVSMLFHKAGRSMFAFIIGVVLGSTALVTIKQIWSPIMNPAAAALARDPSEVATVGEWFANSGVAVCWIAAVVAAVAGLGLVLLLAKLDPRND